jgi:hypothetical protein
VDQSGHGPADCGDCCRLAVIDWALGHQPTLLQRYTRPTEEELRSLAEHMASIVLG